MKRYIYAFSQSRKEIERMLYGHTKQIIENICKLVLMPNHSARAHWMKEIASQLYDIDKLSTNNRYPTKKQIFDWSYKKQQDLVSDVNRMRIMMRHLKTEYNIESYMEPSMFSEIADTICVEYFTWLAEKLSIDGFVPYVDIYEMLDMLLEKYSY